jgi:hypothetical protein
MFQEKKESLQRSINESEKQISNILDQMFSQLSGFEIIGHLQNMIMHYHNPDLIKSFIEDSPEGAGEEAARFGYQNAVLTDWMSQLAEEYNRKNNLSLKLDQIMFEEKQSA